PILQRLSKYFSKNLWSGSLQKLIENEASSKTEVLQGLHLLLVKQVLTFGSSINTESHLNAHAVRLKKIAQNISNQNYFEMLCLTRKAKPSEIQRSYQDLAKILHPDKLPPDAPSDLRTLSESVFVKMTE